MKKILSILMVMACSLMLLSCGSKAQNSNSNESVLEEVKGVTIPKFTVSINGNAVTNEDLAEYPIYKSQVTSVNSSGTETTVNYIGFRFVDALEKAGLSGYTSYIEAVADDGYSVVYEAKRNPENMLIAISKDGSQFKKSPWFCPCDSDTTGEFLQGLTTILVNNKNEKPSATASKNEEKSSGDATLNAPEKLDRTDKVTFEAFSFKVAGNEVKNADLEGVKIYKITCDALNSKDAVITSTYTGYVLKDVLDKLGVGSNKKITAVANDGYKVELTNEQVNSEFTLIAIEKDKELGKDGTVWLAPCEEDRTKKYASNVVEIMVE
ncbi:MAG: hypothetical protein IKI71_03895 [Lachnospiraceae bacterium]|nr:hypothetical protein [Lachnospiraceae bacterium]